MIEGRLSNFDVRVGDASLGLGSNTLCAHYSGTAADNEIVTITCSTPNPIGKYVSIQLLSDNSCCLTLCEVQVYGSTYKSTKFSQVRFESTNVYKTEQIT